MFVSQQREGNLDDFFKHQNSAFPLCLTDDCQICVTKAKSDFVKCINKASQEELLQVESVPYSSSVIVDGAAMAHVICPKVGMT